MFLSIVVPCYNELRNIERLCSKVDHYFKRDPGLKTLAEKYGDRNPELYEMEKHYELILVDGGSTDSSINMMNSMARSNKHIRVIDCKANRGKGYTVKMGFEHAKGSVVMFMDADLATDLSALTKSLSAIIRFYSMGYNHFAIIGNRYHPKSQIVSNYSLVRKMMSKGCILYVNMLFDMQIHDSQCGFKVFDRDTAQYLANYQIIDGFAFDVEYLNTITHDNNIVLKEIPVIWNNEDISTVVPIKSTVDFIIDTIRLKRNLKRKKRHR